MVITLAKREKTLFYYDSIVDNYQLLFPLQVITQPINIMTLLICKGKCAPAVS